MAEQSYFPVQDIYMKGCIVGCNTRLSSINSRAGNAWYLFLTSLQSLNPAMQNIWTEYLQLINFMYNISSGFEYRIYIDSVTSSSYDRIPGKDMFVSTSAIMSAVPYINYFVSIRLPSSLGAENAEQKGNNYLVLTASNRLSYITPTWVMSKSQHSIRCNVVPGFTGSSGCIKNPFDENDYCIPVLNNFCINESIFKGKVATSIDTLIIHGDTASNINSGIGQIELSIYYKNIYLFGEPTSDSNISINSFCNNNSWIVSADERSLSYNILTDGKFGLNLCFISYMISKTTSKLYIYYHVGYLYGYNVDLYEGILTDVESVISGTAKNTLYGLQLNYNVGASTGLYTTDKIESGCQRYIMYYPCSTRSTNPDGSRNYIYAITASNNRGVFNLFSMNIATKWVQGANLDGKTTDVGYGLTSMSNLTDLTQQEPWKTFNSSIPAGRTIYVVQANSDFSQIIMYLTDMSYSGKANGICCGMATIKEIVCFSRNRSGVFKRVGNGVVGLSVNYFDSIVTNHPCYNMMWSQQKPLYKSEFTNDAYTSKFYNLVKNKHAVAITENMALYNNYFAYFKGMNAANTDIFFRFWKIKFAEDSDGLKDE